MYSRQMVKARIVPVFHIFNVCFKLLFHHCICTLNGVVSANFSMCILLLNSAFCFQYNALVGAILIANVSYECH